MKIEYEINLYKKIANFSVNKIVQVANRKGKKSTIHITNITKLSWQELQLLTSNGVDRFSKIVVLYQEYSSQKELSESVVKGNPLSSEETKEIAEYIKIFQDYGCTMHHEVNKVITQKNIWDNFKTIRSLNDHGKSKEIEGIQPEYFEIICSILSITGGKGLPLDDYKKY